MILIRNLLCFVLFHVVICSYRLNMDLTDWVSDNRNDVVFQHDCLHVAASIKKETDPYQIISYCLTEWPPKWDIQEDKLEQKFTFAQLCQENITSRQLYLWSAPMDVTERYQSYLNQLSTSDDLSSMALQLFYNCTSPRFGPLCQYSLDIYPFHDASLNEIIYDFYQLKYDPTNLTCYIHLECNRGSILTCLDWSEICDGTVDCQDGIDENSCWQLEINECEDNEYRCHNGQCISKVFFRDDPSTFECSDKSDEVSRYSEFDGTLTFDAPGEPTFTNEDIVCLTRLLLHDLTLTSSCVRKRTNILKELLWSDKPTSVSNNCWLAVTCELRGAQTSDPNCRHLCSNKTCKQIINETCPDMLNVPAGTIAFGHIFFLYTKEDINNQIFGPAPPRYVCYNDQFCDGLQSNQSLISFNNATCRHPTDISLNFNSMAMTRSNWYNMYVLPIYGHLLRCNEIKYNGIESCNSSTMYKCMNSSKCISKHRLCDTVGDCHLNDDEECNQINGSCSIYGLENLFKCTTTNVCISSTSINDEVCHCLFGEYGYCDDEILDLDYKRKHISFPTICDGFTELTAIAVDGRNETDETECEYWQCNNTYTRCDGFWNCLNGADEIDCDLSPLLKCPSHHHICVSSNTNDFICLPLEKANDGIIDCLGGTDEPKLCRRNNYKPTKKNFYCISYADEVCVDNTQFCYKSVCKDGTDQQFCDTSSNRTFQYSICGENHQTIRTKVENFFCVRQDDTNKPEIVHFALGELPKSSNHPVEHSINLIISYSSIRQATILPHQQFCHRGLPLRVWLNTNENLTTTTVCLCPPSFYGNLCQNQNQRVSLTMRLQVFSDSRRTLFALVISLIDDSRERIIHSFQQVTYLYTEHCRTKFNIYLLYSTRPKLSTKNYSIHIDIYEKISLSYRGSLFLPLQFSILPVHRIAALLHIPRTTDTTEFCTDQQCKHGQCIKYSNDPKETSFCHCDREWSGRDCTVPYVCTCSSDSVCVGISANNRSICVCPFNKWGSHCLLHKTICHSKQNATCQNGGQCIPIDENMIPDKQFVCICPKGFSGKSCEITDSKIIVSFHHNISLPHTILIHFIRVFETGPVENGSTFKTIPINQNSITIYWPHPFHIVLIQLLDKDIYLVAVQKIYNRSLGISKTIDLSDRCEHLSKILNGTIVNLHLLRRIKYYHLSCQKLSPLLSCFYDDNYFCLCNDSGHQRIANCFEFNSSKKHDCFGQSNCQNGAQCLQDRFTCPQTSMCICPQCYYGARCQFSSTPFGLSLDAILGYHIQPHIHIGHQPQIVQVSIGLTMIMFIVGLFNGVLSLITFKNEEARKAGCGVYLMVSSINCLFITIILILKFWILISAQITYMTNRSFLYIQCLSMDFLLHIGLNMDHWLSACVAIDRAFTIIKRTQYNKKKSKQMAKYVIATLLFLTISTTIHDPIHRRLLDENDNDVEENRIWCIVSYSTGFRAFNSFISMFHFFAPFITNIICSIIIIIMTARQRTTVQTQEPYCQLLYKQFREHLHLLIAPLLLIILALPRLIISLVGGCMKSTNESWLFLIGYLISFVPSMLTMLVFVVPSKFYKQIFQKTMKQYRRTIRTWLNLCT